jgi:sterol desaturase/sphingolipid hydroxylase (fatty acid hydroxylase superfamily)
MEVFVAIGVPVLYLLAIALERLRPGRPQPSVRGWLGIGLAFFVMVSAMDAVVPGALAALLAPRALFDLGHLGVVGGGLVAFVVADAMMYGVHRAMHRSNLLWRFTHQLHHSAERVDAVGVTFFHPLDVAIQIATVTGAALLLGVSPAAAALSGFLYVGLGIFQHTNIRTPVWIGYLVQRPEAHAIHHARGVHAYNYGNLVIWDVLFGTYRNPVEFTAPAGLRDGASRRIGAMLIGRDIDTLEAP